MELLNLYLELKRFPVRSAQAAQAVHCSSSQAQNLYQSQHEHFILVIHQHFYHYHLAKPNFSLEGPLNRFVNLDFN